MPRPGPARPGPATVDGGPRGAEELLGEPPAGTLGDGPGDVREQQGGDDARVAALALVLVLLEVLGELALQRATDLLPVRTQLAERLVDLLGEHRLRQLLL